MRLRTFDGGGDTVHDGRLATDIKDRFADSGVPPQSAGENYTKIQTRCSDYVCNEEFSAPPFRDLQAASFAS